jgi:hypothetical protein
MSWRDRAKPVEGGWRARAKPVELDTSQEPPEPDSLDFMKPERTTGAVLGGIQQGVTLRFGDEMAGAAGAVEEASKRTRQAIGIQDEDPSDADPALNPNQADITKSWGPTQLGGDKPVITQDNSPRPRPSLADTYRSIRDRDRDSNKTSEKAHPIAYGAGELAGGLAVPIPGAGLMKGAPLIAKAGLGAAQAGGLGMAYGLGGSEKEDLEGMRDDSIETGLKTAPFGVAGAVVGHGLGKLGERFGAKAKNAETSLRADKVSEKLKSAVGTHGHDVQDANRTLFNIEEALRNPALDAAERAALLATKETPEYAALLNQVARNTREAMPNKLGDMARSKQGIADAPALAMKEVDDYLAKNTLTADVLPRAAHYGKPALAAAVGGVAGGPAGAAAGGLLGAAAGAPGRSIANLTKKTPRFTIQANQALQSVAEGSETALQKLANQLGISVEELVSEQLRKRFGGE